MRRKGDAASLAAEFAKNRERLMGLVRKHLKPVLLKRMDYEDVLSAVYENSAKRLVYFSVHAEVPAYFKFRTILFQTLIDLERRNLAAQSRDVCKEVNLEGGEEKDDGGIMELPADVTSPASRVDRDERHQLLKAAIAALPATDREIIVLRHFDELGNNDCAAVLGIEPKAASIRYVRALEKLQGKLLELSCFRMENGK